LEVAFEEGSGVLEVGFGVGFGGGEARKCFVQDGDDAPLLGEGGKWNQELLEFIELKLLMFIARKTTLSEKSTSSLLV